MFCDITKYRKKNFEFDYFFIKTFTRVSGQMGQKILLNSLPPPLKPKSFSPVTCTNVGLSPKNVLTLVLTLLPYWCKMPRSYLVPVPYY